MEVILTLQENFYLEVEHKLLVGLLEVEQLLVITQVTLEPQSYMMDRLGQKLVTCLQEEIKVLRMEHRQQEWLQGGIQQV